MHIIRLMRSFFLSHVYRLVVQLSCATVFLWQIITLKLIQICFVQCLGVQKSTTEILQRQKRTWILESFMMNEDYKGPFPYSLGTVSVITSLSIFRKISIVDQLFFDYLQISMEKSVTLVNISGEGVDQDPIGLLQINGVTGEITVNHPVVYKEFPYLKVRKKFVISRKVALTSHKAQCVHEVGVSVSYFR